MTETTCCIRRTDPPPEQILQECQRIQAEWSPDERLKRMRCDLRPYFRRCDGVQVEMTDDDYQEHHNAREAIPGGVSDG